MPNPPPDPITRKTLRGALRSWDNSQKLGAHALARLRSVEARRRAAGYGDTLTGYGVALRDVLAEALGRLKPDGAPDPADKRWRPYLILHGQYIEGRSPDFLLAQLSVARSTYDHEQADAFESLASFLRDGEQTAPEMPPDAATPPFLAPARPDQPLAGRDALLQTLTARLFTHGLAALNGLPGVGKTALAIHLAHDQDVQARYPDGVLWAGLTRSPDLLAVLGVWAVALGLPLDAVGRLSRVEDRARVIHAAIGLRRMLIVIDDAWTIEDALAFKIGGPNCACLLTTRLPGVALDFAGEAALTVHELDDSDGLALLARYGVGVAEAEARALVRAVGGLPLALSLMGHSLQRETRAGQPRRLRSALDRLQQIGERLSLAQMRSPLEAQPGVPLSLLTVIASTDDALDPDSRATLRSLSIFPSKPNTFSEEAALAVTGAPVATLDTLVDFGLLEAAPSGRYTLHQTISEYAAHRVETVLHRRGPFASYFIDFTAAHAARHDLLEPELSNILTALNIAFEDDLQADLARGANALYAFLETRGLHTLIELHLIHAEAYARQVRDRPGLCDALGNLARVAHRRGDYAVSEARYGEALGLANAMDDPTRVSALLSGMGVLAFSRGDYDQAESCYAEGLRLARALGDPLRVSAILANMGALALNRGFTAQAETHLQEGLSLARALGDRSRAGALLINLGVCAARQGDYARAEASFQESLELARGAGHREQILFLLTNLGTLASDRQDGPGAEARFREALALAREMNDRARISQLLANLGALAVSRQDFVQAEALYAEGLDLARAIGHRENLALLLLNCGDMKKVRGQADGAGVDYGEALALARAMGHQRYVQAIEQRLAGLAGPP